MDINKDLAKPDNNLLQFEDGKFFYRSSSGDFDVDKFNRSYDQYKERRKKEKDKKMTLRLNELNEPKEEIPAYSKPIGQVLIDTKDALFEILDDLLQRRIEINTFKKNHRMFYIGLTMIFIAVFLYMLIIAFGDSYDSKNNGFIVKIVPNNL